VLEDDRGVRDILSTILTEADYEVICFAEGNALLALARTRIPACILLDIFVPGKSGLELLEELHADRYLAPIVMISGHGDVAMTVSAFKLGALDFIEKPFRGPEIVARVSEAIDSYACRRCEGGGCIIGRLHFRGHEPLSKREQEVLGQFVSGTSTKETARALGLSPRTVEGHRSRIMRKLHAKNCADLMRIVMTAARNSCRDPVA